MSRPRTETAIVGLGRWGTRIAERLASVSELRGYVTEHPKEHADWANTHAPSARAMALKEVCADTDIAAVAVATPISTHARITETLLRAEKHVFVEKPLALSAEEAHALAALAKENERILMTGYIFLFHPLYEELKERSIAAPIKRLVLTWHKYGTFTEPIEWNLLTHHLALALDLCGMPTSGAITYGKGIESKCDQLTAQLQYSNVEVVSRIDRTSTQKMHTIEATLSDDSVLVLSGTRLTDENDTVLQESSEEPLTREMNAFIKSIADETSPRTDGDFAARVLEIHEMLATNTN